MMFYILYIYVLLLLLIFSVMRHVRFERLHRSYIILYAVLGVFKAYALFVRRAKQTV